MGASEGVEEQASVEEEEQLHKTAQVELKRGGIV